MRARLPRHDGAAGGHGWLPQAGSGLVHDVPPHPAPQADMVGFTKLSATHPPQRVLGLLSDIFEASDRPCETRRVEG